MISQRQQGPRQAWGLLSSLLWTWITSRGDDSGEGVSGLSGFGEVDCCSQGCKSFRTGDGQGEGREKPIPGNGVYFRGSPWPQASPTWQEKDLETFVGLRGLLISDSWIHFKIHCIGGPQGRGVWEGELLPR